MDTAPGPPSGTTVARPGWRARSGRFGAAGHRGTRSWPTPGVPTTSSGAPGAPPEEADGDDHGRPRTEHVLCDPMGASPTSCGPITFERDFTEQADGSVLVRCGGTRVLCTASVEEDVPRWMRGSGKGWVTAEYRMLPGSSASASAARRPTGKQSVAPRRSSASSAVRCAPSATWRRSGERQVVVDCDVLQADGGTRTASICRRLPRAARRAHPRRAAGRHRRRTRCARPAPRSRSASSAACRCSTCPTSRTRTAEVDMNVVMTGSGPLRRGAGHGRGPGLQPATSSTSCSTLAEKGIARDRSTPQAEVLGRRRPPPRAASSAMRFVASASANPDKARRDRGDPRRRGRAAAPPAGRARRGRGRRDARGQRPAQGGRHLRGHRARPRSPTTPGSRSTRSAARPACCAARYAGEDATYDDNVAKLLGRAAQVGARDPSGAARFRTVALVAVPRRPRARRRRRRRGHDRHRAPRRRRLRLRPGLRPRRRRRPHLRRDDRRREARHLPPRPRPSVPSPPALESRPHLTFSRSTGRAGRIAKRSRSNAV